MNKNGYKNKTKSKYTYQSNNKNISNNEIQINNLEDDQDFCSHVSNQERPGRIIHQSTEHSYDDMGNQVVTTKTVREIDSLDNKNKNFNNSKKSYATKASQGSKQDKAHRNLNIKNEIEKQRALYSSPDFQSGSPYDSPIYMNDYDEEYQTNYRFEKRDINRKKIGKFTKNEAYQYKDKSINRQISENNTEQSPEIEIISPVGYIENNSSGSEYEDNPMKSFDNYQSSVLMGNNYNFNYIPMKRNINYEIEDPEGFDYLRNNDRTGNNKYSNELKNSHFLHRSEKRRKIIDDSYQSGKDFQSPERNINEGKKFRKVTVGMIDSKGPTNDDRKVTKIMTNKIVNVKGNKINEKKISKTKRYKNKIPKNKKYLSKIEAAKIIQAWWRKRFAAEEEVYDITVKKAIKLQSFIRGFLVRKKVLRYITLAIYYQSFCDKLQDILCNNIKKDLFYYLKNKFLNNTSIPRKKPIRPINDNKSNSNIPNSKNIREILNKTKRANKQRATQKRNHHIIKISSSFNTETNQYPSNYPTSVNYKSPKCYLSPITYTNTQIRSPETYQSRQTDVKIYHISPDIYNRNRKNNYIHNKSLDNSIYDREKIKFNKENRYNYTVDNIYDNERIISPTFGVLAKKEIGKKRMLTSNNSINNIKKRKRIYKSNSNNNITNSTTIKTTKTIITSGNSAKKPIKMTTKKIKFIKKNKIPKIPKGKNEIISGGTLSIIKLPNRRLNNSESEDVYTRIKEKRIEKYERYKKEKRDSKIKQLHDIDNQLSINIIKIPTEEDIFFKKAKKEREEYVRYIEKPVEIIKEGKKTVKDPKPETAEEGNDTQIFDMKIIQGVAMSIEPSSETKEIIKEELKEIEIFKKREKERNKQINKYKKYIEKQKRKNKLDKLKNALRIAEYSREKNLRKKFQQFKKNCSQENELQKHIDIEKINIIKDKKEFGIQYKMEETNQIKIEQNKPELIDMEVQHEPEDNYIEKSTPFTIKGEKRKVDINDIEKDLKKPKNIEVQIRTVKRSLVKIEIPLLKRLWLRKAFRTFRDNCKRPEYHKIIGREILRMALLKWRFIKGYGPDRYGNVYDRDGNLLYKTKAQVADSEVQQEFKVEQEDEGTQYIPIENIIATLKQIEIGATYKRKKTIEKVDQYVGDNIKLSEEIQRGETITYKNKKKEKPENKITKNQIFEIKKNRKECVDQGTEMQKLDNQISKLEKLNISGDEYKLRNKIDLRKKELLIQMIYRKMMGDKLTLSDALRQWLKQTLLFLQVDQFNLEKKKIRNVSISKNDRFAIMEEIKKIEMDSQMEKNNKKTIILETQKENEMNILGLDYIFKEEIKKGIHHPMTEEGKRRVNEILIKYFKTRGDPISLLRKYFSIWKRKATYLACFDNAKIITEFCRANLNRTKNYRRWKKICEKLILQEKLKIIKLSRIEDIQRNKIFDLIRITRINQVLAKKRYLHYILLCWLAYMKNMKRKREHVKALYENMLNTYMHMADDIFGNNQKENPSVQDALFEAVESDKFHTRDLHDVPLADKYYQEKKEIKKVTTNLTYVNDNNSDNEPKEYITYKAFICKHPLTISSSNDHIKKKVIREKVIKLSPGERLQSKGRGRKFRTSVEREILNKFYDDKKLYSKIRKNEEEKENNETNIKGGSNGNGYYGENKNINIRITRNKMDNKLVSSYNYSMNLKDINLNKSPQKKEMSYKKGIDMFRFQKEDEKEMEDDEKLL